MKNFFLVPLFTLIVFSACSDDKIIVDLIIHHAKIYSVDSSFSLHEAMAVQNGKVIELNTSKNILKKYSAKTIHNLEGKTVFPGFIDAHCHFLAYGLGLGKVDLVGTKSFREVIARVYTSSQKEKSLLDANSQKSISDNGNSTWILGRGWDQNDWGDKEMPDKKILDSLFPKRPVMLTRIDGHAVLVNSAALKLAGINGNTKIQGGEIIKINGEPTGVLVDNAIDLVRNKIPATEDERKKDALVNAQSNCLAMGLTTVDDAGLMKNEVDLIDGLQKDNKLKIRMYVMLSDSGPNYRYFLDKGPYKTERLNVRSFKFYVDGALGSRGACLHEDYTDKPGWKGFLLSPIEHFEKYASILNEKGFQMNAHCIGDSSLSAVIGVYKQYCKGNGERRWRIEHAQVVAPKDFKNFSKDIIPSVQPTHGTSDMYWVEERLGKNRSKNAYAYKDLLNAAGTIALGTDFPVEDISPFKTFFAAVARQDSTGYPKNGFQKENALSREQTLRGMTIWAAYSNFEENEKGSLEKGKLADFVILNNDLLNCETNKILSTKVLATYINGELVYSIK